MAEKDVAPHHPTELVIVPCLFCSGLNIEVGDGFVRIVGFVDLETAGYSGIPERRIIARVVMPSVTARSLVRDLRKALATGGH